MFSKFFITGVSPIDLSHVTSGFNIQANVSFDDRLSGLCGLTRDDVKHALSVLPLKKASENEALPPNQSANDKDIDDLANISKTGFSLGRLREAPGGPESRMIGRTLRSSQSLLKQRSPPRGTPGVPNYMSCSA